MKHIQIIALATVLAVSFGCDPAPKETPTTQQPGTTAASTQVTSKDVGAPVTPVLPANLQHDGYRYYGLSRTEPMYYDVTVDNGGGSNPPQVAGQSIAFEGMDAGKAKFVINRTGALSRLGSMHVVVDPKGVTIVSTSPGKMDGTQLDMPANPTPGTTWKSDYKIDFYKSDAMPEGGTSTAHLTDKIVGVQKVTTKAGTFDALLVESNENDLLNGKPATIHSQSWYVKDRGLVKMVVDTKQANGSATMTIEEVPDSESK